MTNAEVDERLLERSICSGLEDNGNLRQVGGDFRSVHHYAGRQVVREEFQLTREVATGYVHYACHSIAAGNGNHLARLRVALA